MQQTNHKQNLASFPPCVSFINSPQRNEEAFREAMHQVGVMHTGAIIDDGQIHRFPTGNKNNPDGWYVFYGMAGSFGDWRRDIREKWNVKSEHLKEGDKERLIEQINKAKQTAEEEQLRKHEETAVLASKKWASLSETGRSPYLEKKEVDGFNVRYSTDKDVLVIPLKDITGKLWSLQWINPDGTKRFLTGGRKKGFFHHIGNLKNGDPIIIVEGYVTGASIHMAAQKTVVIAFDAGNLDPVIEDLKKVYPKSSIVIAGDDDCWNQTNTGREKAEEAAQQYGCSVIFPQFKDTGTKPTDFNDLHVLEGLAVVKEQIDQILKTLEWPDPTPLKSIKKDLSPVIPLPAALIPEPYQPWLTDIAERMQCPLDYVAVAALIASASLIGAGCRVRPKKNDSWSIVPNLWGGIVGRPSTLKSPSLKEVLKPMKALEQEAFATFEKERQAHEIELESHKVQKEAIRKRMGKAADLRNDLDIRLAMEELKMLKEPQAPIWKRYCTNDTTIEKMHELLSQNPRGLLLYRDELMGLLTTWDKVGHEADRSFYLEAWNGDDSKTTDRIGRGTTHTKSLCISILGSTQPDKLLSYFQQTMSGFCNDGLLQRFQLLVYPDEVKDWTLIDKKPNITAQREAASIMKALATMNFCEYGAVQEGEDTPYFCFTDHAQHTFFMWLTELEREKLIAEEEPILLEHFAKYRKLMPSLALIFHLINIASGKARGPISVECVERAAAWCEYLEHHARRIYEMGLSPGYQAARNLARRIQSRDLNDSFDARDVYRKEWAFLKTREEVEAACELLIDLGWLKEAALSEGRKAKRCFTINPKILKRGNHE
jgi:putative DNA primase/helicase